MIVHTAYFDKVFVKMARMLGRCLAEHCPDAEYRPVELPHPLQLASNPPGHVAWNMAKLEEWNRQVQAAEVDIICMDTDMIVLGDLGPAFDTVDFDFGYTVRPGPHRINAGLVFVRPTEAGKAFFQRWTDRNAEVSADSGAIKELIRIYGGANQASLGLTLKGAQDTVFREFDCAVWNSVRQTWYESILGLGGHLKLTREEQLVGIGPFERFARPVVIHINSHLRRACFTGRELPSESKDSWMNPLIKRWIERSKR